MKKLLIHFLQVSEGSKGESVVLVGLAGRAGPRFLKTSSKEVGSTSTQGEGRDRGFCSLQGLSGSQFR